MKHCLAITVSLAALVSANTGLAQEASEIAQEPAADAQESDEPEYDDDTIVVTSTRIRGQLIVDQPPIAEYDEEDIAAFGGGSIADIIEAIQPATSTGARGSRGGGRPVFLINGIRVSSWREFRSYPPESVAKIEVFPEEVAQRFGYSPDQRVVNIILKPNFQSVTAEVEYEQPSRGGYSYNEQELTYLRIGEKARVNFNAEVEDRSLLTEAERGLAIEGREDEAPFRSLVSDTWAGELTANYARAFMESGDSISLNATLNRDRSRSLSGLANDGLTPLERRSETDTLSLGGTFNSAFGDWKSNFTSDVVFTDGETQIDRFDASGFDVADSKTYSITNNATLTGYPIALPAGDVAVTLDAGLDWKRIESADTRSDTDLSLTRRRVDGGINLAVPIAERDGALGAIGDLSLNLSAGIDELSDFGVLTDWTAGATWRPFENLTLGATYFRREVAPSLTDLGSPRIDEFNVPVFDYASGATELVTLVTGGNANLVAETQSDWKFSGNWRLPFWEDARLNLEYGINRSNDVTSTPGFSAAFEEAFPDRVTRDAGGDLLAIDRRPITLFQTRSRILSIGFNARGQIGKAPEREERSGRGAGREAQQGSEGARSGFDPARMEALRKAFCEVPQGEMPDLSQIPEQFRARLLDDSGNPDPEKIAAARERFCGEGAEQRSERFAAMRTAICADPPQLDGLPEAMLARLRNEDGEIDPERLKALRERMCSADGAQAEGQARGGGRRGGGMNPFNRGGDDEDKRPRYFFSANFDRALENEILLADGGPLFDQLAGDVLGGSAIAANSARIEGGLFWQGYGLRLSGRYTGKARLNGSGLSGSSDLFFDDLATLDLRLFADLGEVFDKDEGWLKGLRVSLKADNIFDARRRVVDEDGVVPDAYDPLRIDPTGRYLGIDVRKAF